MKAWLKETGEVYEGQFGTFTITRHDRLEVVLYRGALTLAALAFGVGSLLAVVPPTPWIKPLVAACFGLFCLAFGVSLWTIHIYLKPLHRALQLFWGAGCLCALGIAIAQPSQAISFILTPFSIGMVGVGLIFVALTGLFIKEAFCFNHWQTRILTPLVPFLLLGHWLGLLPSGLEQGLLLLWAGLFLWFALRKDFQAIPPDIGDKSVFAYLAQQRQAAA